MPKILRGEKKVDKKELKKERKAQKKAYKKARRKYTQPWKALTIISLVAR